MKISKKIMRAFLEIAADTLPGDWIIIGGAVLPLIGVEYRVTVDIDLAAPKLATQEHSLRLMEIAERLNLPPEAINQAGAFFLHRIKGWEKQLVEVHQGKRGRILRPNIALYIQLKIPRLSESDLNDCIKMLQKIPRDEFQALPTLLKEMEKRVEALPGNEDKRGRMAKLMAAVRSRSKPV